MKANIKRSLGVVVAALLAMPLAAPVLADGAVVQSISGSGGFFSDGRLRTFTFTAQKDMDGNVKGQWTRVVKTGSGPNHGEITCFEDYGDYVLGGGFVNSGIFSEPPFNWTLFWFADNGEGAGTDPDVVSLQWLGFDALTTELYCANAFGPFFPSFEVTQGNLQVH